MPAAVLLAAGEARRMGRPKQLLDWGGVPLVTAQVHALLDGGCAPVIVVLGAHAALVEEKIPRRADVQRVTNRQWHAGRSSSLRCGARLVPDRADAVVIASVDQPVRPATIQLLSAALRETADALIAVPRHLGKNGHPPLLHAQLLPALRSVTERTEGVRALRRRYAAETIFLEVNDPFVRLNLNTPAAYEQARELAHELARQLL